MRGLPNNCVLFPEDQPVDPSHFRCCGDEDLVFLRCAHCGHIWVHCHECDTLYVDLDDLDRIEAAMSNKRLICVCCDTPFGDLYFLKPHVVHRYMPTAEQVIVAGYGHYLADALRNRYGIA
ncbi:hypothetical protein DD235_01300 [Corticimicrobacter populi]|uniref:Uncharacterized protein n=1 Tax=Corticimicrobacter populi TaxID=2175229 RepID=A0A2V1K5K7_9BURK|nr:hypothetical protein DD235_01300 [Corticimicrobacter populi]